MITKGIIISLAGIFITVGFFCKSTNEETKIKKIVYWTAPSVEVTEFERGIVAEWNSTHPDNQIDWKTIPAGRSSEEVILTAIATKTGPDICSNIFGGFAAQLADAKVIVALDTLPGFWEVVEKRKMTNIINKNWFYKGHVYVLPVYINPTMMWYNKKILDELGVSELPATYSEFLKLAEKALIPKKRYVLLTDPTSRWYRRWFDYITMYCAASGGAPYLDIENNNAYFDSKAGIAVTEFYYQIFKNGYASRFEYIDGFKKGKFLAAIKGTGEIVRTKKMYPDLEYVITPMLIPDFYPDDQPVYTLGESKGMVLYSNSKNKKQAWEFMKWFLSDKHDLLWMQKTNLLPTREDLLTNSIFKEYFEENPKLKLYANMVNYSAPLALTPHTVEIQMILNRELWQPIIFGKKNPLEAARDANKTIEKFMKSGP